MAPQGKAFLRALVSYEGKGFEGAWKMLLSETIHVDVKPKWADSVHSETKGLHQNYALASVAHFSHSSVCGVWRRPEHPSPSVSSASQQTSPSVLTIPSGLLKAKLLFVKSVSQCIRTSPLEKPVMFHKTQSPPSLRRTGSLEKCLLQRLWSYQMAQSNRSYSTSLVISFNEGHMIKEKKGFHNFKQFFRVQKMGTFLSDLWIKPPPS